jgi:DtxR family Mn-dependent transcriptional regulator
MVEGLKVMVGGDAVYFRRCYSSDSFNPPPRSGKDKLLGLTVAYNKLTEVMPSATVEDYIKQIYLASEGREDDVPMGSIAEALGVVPGTATTMMKTLADAGLVVYAPRVGVQLSTEGRALALMVIRRHRLIEQFLVQILGFDWSEVHAEAEKLEHVVSDRMLERIDRLLGHPTEDPHGDPIPSAQGELADADDHSLGNCPMGQALTVARVGDQQSTFLRFATDIGLVPGANLRVDTRNAAAQSVGVTLLTSGTTHTLGVGAAEKIFVRALD